MNLSSLVISTSTLTTDSYASKFLSSLSAFNLIQHVSFTNHKYGHTLHLVITSVSSDLSSTFSCELGSPSDSPIITKTQYQAVTSLPNQALLIPSYQLHQPWGFQTRPSIIIPSRQSLNRLWWSQICRVSMWWNCMQQFHHVETRQIWSNYH